MQITQDNIKGAFIGLAMGDALGVPREFWSREQMLQLPMTSLEDAKYPHYQDAGTFSDDTSLSMCLAQAICDGFSIERLAQYMLDWYQHGFWAADTRLFDIGNITESALIKLGNGESPYKSGGIRGYDNGNGSLMRILPFVFYGFNMTFEQRVQLLTEISGITHRHIRSVLSCIYFEIYARELLLTKDKLKAYVNANEIFSAYAQQKAYDDELEYFERILKGDLHLLSVEAIHSSGYVIYTLEAALWCFFTTNNYTDAVLLAVNLGGDTDTTASVTGGLAGIYYGSESIPLKWLHYLKKRTAILELSQTFYQTIKKLNNYA